MLIQGCRAMSHMLRNSVLLMVAGLLAASTGVPHAHAQKVGGPYEPDSNTVVLLHFDGDVTNESDLSADPLEHGAVRFVSNPFDENLGQVLYLDNDAEDDSSYLAIPDTAALDLTESWTMEAWVFLLTYGDTSEDWRWRPKLLVKPGTDVRSHSNYYNVLRGDLRAFNTGFWSPSGGGWHDIRSPNNFFNPLTWYHVTFIRDHERNTIIQIIHDVDGELIHFESRPYDPILNNPPNTTDEPAYIGINLGQGGGWLDGFVDELRISNIVRPVAAPPIIADETVLPNQSTEGPFTIDADVSTLTGGQEVSQVTLHYNLGAGWQETPMSSTGETTYSGSIPTAGFGSVVQYYVSAETADGMRSTVPNEAESGDDPVYYSFAVVDPEALVLHLNFEDDDGTVASKGDYDLPITMGGAPEFADGNAPEGNRAIRFDGTSFLEIDARNAAFLNGEQFAIDMWFMAQDSIPQGGTRLLIHEGGDSWNNFNYQIWSSGGGDITPASFFPENGVRNGGVVGPDSTIEADKWYRIVYVLDEDTTFSRLYDANNDLIQEVGGTPPGAVNMSTGPFHIAGHSPALNDNDADGLPDGPLFKGMMDDIKIYNYVPEAYAATGTAAERDELPSAVQLLQNYPNPFNPVTTIEYTIPHSMHVTLDVYDVLGRKVMTLVDDQMPTGSHAVRVDATGLASGLYLYKLETDNQSLTRQMLLVK